MECPQVVPVCDIDSSGFKKHYCSNNAFNVLVCVCLVGICPTGLFEGRCTLYRYIGPDT